MRLIGLNGFKTSGKDTTYQLIKRIQECGRDDPHGLSFNGRVERRAFADNLKIMAAQALGLAGSDEELIEAMNVLKESGKLTADLGVGSDFNPEAGFHTITGREYLQNFGQRAREVFWDTFWIDQVVPANEAEFVRIWSTVGRDGASLGLPAIGCVTDVRYENEAQRILDLGGEIWEVVRPGLESDGHSSEIPLPRDLVTLTINNDGDLEDLSSKVFRTLIETSVG